MANKKVNLAKIFDEDGNGTPDFKEKTIDIVDKDGNNVPDVFEQGKFEKDNLFKDENGNKIPDVFEK